jgi:cytochrome c oxidase subunit 2
MDPNLRLFPEQASTAAPQVDALYSFLWWVTGFFTLLIFVLIVFFALKYRRRNKLAPGEVGTSYALELAYTIIPFIIVMVIFFWGARVYFFVYRPPPDALSIHVIGRQWMWKVQHENGKREINSLHVPLNQPVVLTLASQDVIHSFFIPAFRVKVDAVPGRYTKMWFTATKPGVYKLFCTEYCGTLHSAMIGTVTVLPPEEYQAWLTGTGAEQPPAEAGREHFTNLGCITCHGSVAPSMAGLFGARRQFEDGTATAADENYLRESILRPAAKVVAGYQPLMPSYEGQIGEEGLMQLIAEIKALGAPALAPPEGAPTAAETDSQKGKTRDP